MRSEKAWYWLAAGVLALGLNLAYQDGQLSWAHCLAGRAANLIERASERGLRLVTMAEWMLGGSPENFGRTEAVIQKIRTKLVCQRVAMAQRQMAMADVRRRLAEAEVQRELDFAQMKMDKVRAITIDHANRFRNCPGFSQVVVDIPEIPSVDLSNLPDIQMPEIPEIRQMPQAQSHGPI
jgi:hypothetical protein